MEAFKGVEITPRTLTKLQIEKCDQFHALADLPSKEIPHSSGCIRVCVDTKSGLDASKKRKISLSYRE